MSTVDDISQQLTNSRLSATNEIESMIDVLKANKELLTDAGWDVSELKEKLKYIKNMLDIEIG